MNLYKLIANNLFGRKKADKTVPEKKPAACQYKNEEEPEDASSFRRMDRKNNSFYFTSKKRFVSDGIFKTKTIDTVFDFSYKMTFGGAGEHRDHRSGGLHERKNGEIFANTFQGKLAECAVCNAFHTMGYTASPDFATYALGQWDSADLIIAGKKVSIKSTKSFGQLLLLETKDWDSEGRYIPNIESDGGYYDIIIFVRLDPSCEDLLKNARLMFSDTADRIFLYQLIYKEEWKYNCVGFISHEDLEYIIKNHYILPQNSLLNGKIKMDAENYYVQAGDMKPIEKIKEYLK